MIVSNLGPSGEDGLAIELGAAQGFHLDMDLPPDLPVGFVLTWRCVATIPGEGDMVAGVLRIEHMESGFLTTPDFSAGGVPTYTLQALLDGRVVHEEKGKSGPAALAASMGKIPGICEHPSGNSRNTNQEFAEPVDWDFGAGLHVLANTLHFLPENAEPLPAGTVYRIELQATGISELAVAQEYVLMFAKPGGMGQAHRALGDAQFDITTGKIALENIGSSGEDGVRLDFEAVAAFFGGPSVHSVDVELMPLELATMSAMTLQTTGQLAGVPDSQLGETQLQERDGQITMSADLSPLGGEIIRVEVYSAGELAGSFDTPHGVVGSLAPTAHITGCESVPSCPLPGFVWRTELPVDFATVRGPVLVADEIRLFALDSTVVVERLTTLELRLATQQPGQFAIIGEAVPAECAADVNYDCIVNGADLGLLLGAWGGQGQADLNGDGVVDGADLGLLLGAWGACPAS